MAVLRYVIVLSLLAIGGAHAKGSLTFTITAPDFGVEFIVEQQVAEYGAWTVYTGSGFGASLEGVTRFDPFVLTCTSIDGWVVWLEQCFELRAPIVGSPTVFRSFTTVTW